MNRRQYFEDYLRDASTPIFELVEYSLWLGCIGKFLNIVATFAWNFMDLFIILVSVGLTSLFERINEDLNRVKGEVSHFP